MSDPDCNNLISLTYITKLCVLVRPFEAPAQPCNPSPCGPNADCKELNGAGSCTCIAGYFGDPYTGCRPECVQNSDCPRDKSCVNNKCKNPCPGTCGINAECTVYNHLPNCVCLSGYTGNPTLSCHQIPIQRKIFSLCIGYCGVRVVFMQCLQKNLKTLACLHHADHSVNVEK